MTDALVYWTAQNAKKWRPKGRGEVRRSVSTMRVPTQIRWIHKTQVCEEIFQVYADVSYTL